jgi:hypothetical protein
MIRMDWGGTIAAGLDGMISMAGDQEGLFKRIVEPAQRY